MDSKQERKPLLTDKSDFSYTQSLSRKSSKPDLQREVHAELPKSFGSRKKPFFSLFRYATAWDWTLMVMGTVFSVIHGAGWPILSIIFGGMTNQFLDAESVYGVPGANGSNSSNATVGFDQFVSDNSFTDSMIQYSLYYTYVGIAMFAATYGQIACWMTSCERQIFKIRKNFFVSILRQEVKWFDKYQSGELVSKVADDLERMREGIGDKVSLFIQYFSSFIAGFIVGFAYNWKLTLVMMSLTPVLAATGAFMAYQMSSATKREQQKYGIAGGIAEEVLGCIRTVVAFNGQSKEVDRYSEALIAGRDIGIRKYMWMGISLGINFIAMFATYALAFWYGAQLIQDENIDKGTIFTVFFSVMNGSFSIGNASPHYSAVAIAKGAAAFVYDIIDSRPEIDPYASDGEKPREISSKISVRDVHFTYPSRPEVKILKGVSFTVEPGQTVALVGPSGCGKSTIVNLLLRFYDVDKGLITIGDYDLTCLNVKFLRQLTGVVSQEPILFDGSIEENIRYGKQSATLEEVINCCRMSNAHDFIMKLPEAYNTRVGERGAQLSGGQKQRIAIARALVRDPKILLLDEATSALDAESEGIVQEALEKASVGRTTLVIAHRLSTVQNADIIIALKDGEVSEKGNHQELMTQKGLYYGLVTTQMFDSADHPLGGASNPASDHTDDEDSGNDANTRAVTKKRSKLRHRKSSSLIRASSMSSVSTIRSSVGGRKRSIIARGGANLAEVDRLQSEIDEENPPDVGLFEIARENRKYWGSAAMGFIGCTVEGVIMPAFALLYGQIFQTYTKTGDELQSAALFWSMMFLLLGFVQAAAYFVIMYFFARSAEFMTMALRQQVFKNILRQDIGYFDDDRHATGKICTRLSADAPTVRNAVGSRISFVLSAFISLAAGVVIAFIFGWKMALLLCAMLPVLIMANYLDLKLKMSNERRDQLLLEEAGRTATEAIENVRTVQALTQEMTFYRQFEGHLLVPYKEQMKQAQIYACSFAFAQSVVFFIYAASFRFGTYLIENDGMEPLNVYRVFFAISFAGQTVGQATSFIPDYTKARMSAKLIFAMMRYVPRIDSYSVAGLKMPIEGSVTFKDVHFAYPTRAGIRVLKGLTFQASRGKTIALVGASGCGKSTVVAMLERFYDPMDGQILIDDYDIRTINVQFLRSQISLVSQEPMLFNCSIEDNIKYGVEDSTSHDQVVDATKLANIHDFIASLPQGYDTPTGERGAQLSGGQKQRIAIARALVRKPKILLLDEATSALDTESEKIVQAALDNARQGRTCIMIAHRLSTVQSADKIVVIKDGRSVEQGTHSELLAMKGSYFALVKRQNLKAIEV